MQPLRNITKTVRFGACIAALCLLGPSFASAQIEEPLQYIIAPETPGPGEPVMIQAQGIGSFLGNATITWSKDGVVAKSGIGESSYSFVTGSIGRETVVRVTIESATRGTFTKTFRFNPSIISLVWESDTTAPPLHRGKTRYSGGSALKIVAFPTVMSGSSRIAASALAYQWQRGGEPLPQESGLGRSILTVQGDQLQLSEEVSVDVYYGNTKVGRGSISIPVSQPFILVYQHDALRGTLYDQAFPGAVQLLGKELTLKAEPYYFSRTSMAAGSVPFSWTLGGEPISGPDAARGILTLRQAGSGQGSANVGVSLQNNNVDQLVQSAEAALRLIFGQERSSSFFGL